MKVQKSSPVYKLQLQTSRGIRGEVFVLLATVIGFVFISGNLIIKK